MSSAIWKIGTSTLADLNVSSLRITFRNRAADEARIIIDGSLSAPTGLAIGTTYTITKTVGTGQAATVTPVFIGRCERIVSNGSGSSRSSEYILLGGWHWLTLRMFQQSWPKGSAGSGDKSRAILGYDYDSDNAQTRQLDFIGANQQIKNIVARCPEITCGTISASSRRFPLDEKVDATCAEAIDSVLAWWPDAIVYFSYGTGSTVLNIKRCAALADKTISLAGLAEDIQITLRGDLKAPGVKIIYETTSADGAYHDTDVEEAGDASGPGGLVQTISVAGPSYDITSVKIKSAQIHTPLTAAWWASRIPELDGWSDVTLGEHPTFTLSDGTTSSGLPRKDGKTLRYELLSGTIADWMDEAVDRVRITQTASYTLNDQTVEDAVLSIDLVLTSAESKIYQHGTVTPPQTIPHDATSGLAHDLHEAIGRLYHEGTITLVGEDPPDTAGLGDNLLFTGADAPAGWASRSTMNAPVQSVSWDISTGTARLSFGPPSHIGTQDLAARGFANRRRGPARGISSRISASTADDDNHPGPATGSVNTSVGGGRPAKIQVGGTGVFSAAEIDHQSIKLADHAGLGDDAAVISELDSAHGPHTIIFRQRTIPQEEGEGEDPEPATDLVEMAIPATNPTIRLQRGDYTIVLEITNQGIGVDLLVANGPSARLYCAPSDSFLSLISGDGSSEASISSGGQISLTHSGTVTRITPEDYNRLLGLL